ncbi:MAG: tyrosine-type recombinase/integrase [Bacteroidota bacterium]
MKHLEIHNPNYKRLQESFTEWLRLLNFESSTIYYSPVRLTEFFSWLENNHITETGQITRKTIAAYFDYLKARQHQRKGGKLSKNYLRTHLQTLRKFSRYLRETEQDSFTVDYQIKGKSRNVKAVLTREEINQLYQTAGQGLLGLRDRAILAVYYGCGLRKSEGRQLDTSDVLWEKSLLYVRKGKNYQERYVPMTEKVREDLQDYYYGSRPAFPNVGSPAFLLSKKGNRLSGNILYQRFKSLLEKAQIDKPAGLHTLRHSIATHLLQSGMKLEQISHFLGHSSLESTQIYTQVIHEESNL